MGEAELGIIIHNSNSVVLLDQSVLIATFGCLAVLFSYTYWTCNKPFSLYGCQSACITLVEFTLRTRLRAFPTRAKGCSMCQDMLWETVTKCQYLKSTATDHHLWCKTGSRIKKRKKRKKKIYNNMPKLHLAAINISEWLQMQSVESALSEKTKEQAYISNNRK